MRFHIPPSAYDYTRSAVVLTLDNKDQVGAVVSTVFVRKLS